MQMYNLLHDKNKNLILVGNTAYHQHLCFHLNKQRLTDCVTLEFLQEQSVQWINDHQFMCVVSNVKFKKEVKDLFKSLNCDLFSVVGTSTIVDDSCTIGQNVYINQQNYLFDKCIVQDFCTITHQVCLGHNVHLASGVHVSPQCYINYANIKDYSVIGAVSKICGAKEDPVCIPAQTNIMMGSTLTSSLIESGTYFGKKKVSSEDSITRKLF